MIKVKVFILKNSPPSHYALKKFMELISKENINEKFLEVEIIEVKELSEIEKLKVEAFPTFILESDKSKKVFIGGDFDTINRLVTEIKKLL